MEMELNYFKSPAYGELCKRVFGGDMKQIGMVTADELELLYREVLLQPNSNILDIGCGAGYIASAVAKHYNSSVTGIDIHVGTIEHAKKTFSDNLALHFHVMDATEMTFEAESFDLICFFDTLYFESIKKVRLLLDKCFNMLKPNGKIIVFWTNQPANTPYGYIETFEMSEPSANNTQVGLWCNDNQVNFKAFDLTETHRLFWIKGLAEYKALELELTNEMPEEYKLSMGEFSNNANLCEKGDDGGFFRWFYIIEK